jgi:Ni,Fe-hydrogenase III small subunit
VEVGVDVGVDVGVGVAVGVAAGVFGKGFDVPCSVKISPVRVPVAGCPLVPWVISTEVAR